MSEQPRSAVPAAIAILVAIAGVIVVYLTVGSGDTPELADAGVYEEPEIARPIERERPEPIVDAPREEEEVVAPPAIEEPNAPRAVLDRPSDIPRQPMLPIRVGPTIPELTLRRLRGMQNAIDTRVGVMNDELREARAAGDTERVARLERFIARMEAQRPVLEERIRQVEQEAEAPPAEDEPR